MIIIIIIIIIIIVVSRIEHAAPAWSGMCSAILTARVSTHCWVAASGSAWLLFSAHVCCGHGRATQLLLSSCHFSSLVAAWMGLII